METTVVNVKFQKLKVEKIICQQKLTHNFISGNRLKNAGSEFFNGGKQENEFCFTLDRSSKKIVLYGLQKTEAPMKLYLGLFKKKIQTGKV